MDNQESGNKLKPGAASLFEVKQGRGSAQGYFWSGHTNITLASASGVVGFTAVLYVGGQTVKVYFALKDKESSANGEGIELLFGATADNVELSFDADAILSLGQGVSLVGNPVKVPGRIELSPFIKGV